MGNILKLVGKGDKFLNRISMAQELRSKINKWDLMNLKPVSESKDTISRTKQQLTYYKMIFTNPTSDRRLISKT